MLSNAVPTNELAAYYIYILKKGAMSTIPFFFLALLLSLLLNYILITYATPFFSSKPRNWVPQNHQAKNGTPTMGGLAIIGAVCIAAFFCDIWSRYTQLLLFCLIGFGFIGALDDWCKIAYTKGISARFKSGLQIMVATLTLLFLLAIDSFSCTLHIPFFPEYNCHLGWLFIPWGMFIIIGTSNAVNLTDGLDGLAIISLLFNIITYSIILIAQYAFTEDIVYAAQLLSLIRLCFITAGASIGFLWFNCYPASLIMGDVGALSLGAFLGLIALISKQELLLCVTGGIFVIETLSVIAQVISFRVRKKRIFKMAPLHHHFELSGWAESKITTRFSIVSFLCCIVALLATLFW